MPYRKKIIESSFDNPQQTNMFLFEVQLLNPTNSPRVVAGYYKADSKVQLMISCVSANSPVEAEKPTLTHSGRTLLKSTT